MWLKLLSAGLIIAFCTLLGYLAAGKYRARRSYFSQLSALNERYLNELKYRRKPLPDFLAEERFTGDFQKNVREFTRDRRTEVKHSYLTEEEREAANDCFAMLGRGDSRSQQEYFEGKRAYLAEKKRAAEEEAKTRGELYLKLGALAGLAFVVLIV